MKPILHIDGLQSPKSDLNISTPSTARSRFRSLLDWCKHSYSSPRPDDAVDAGCTQSPSSSEQTSSPPRKLRSRGSSTPPRNPERPFSADNKPSPKRDRVLNDPPPLAQAYHQAILHGQLETPASFVQKPHSRGSSQNSKDHVDTEIYGDRIEVKRSHRRTQSGESSCSVREKIFFLINGPYILQYNGDSNGDALPEKILVLDRETVAFACDAVPGRPWVLQISKTHCPPVKSQGQTLRPSWSKLTLRQPEERRTASAVLLIFNDAEELYSWLFAVRKEIEDLGGLEYRPDADDDQSWREDLTRTFALEPVAGLETNPRSRKPSTVQTASTLASPQPFHKAPGLDRPMRTRSCSNRSCASSKKSSISLDRFRDSVTSDGCTSTVATSCADVSASSTSPVYETFPSINAVTERSNADLSLRAYSRGSDTAHSHSRSPRAGHGLLERRKLSITSLHLATPEDTKDYKSKLLPDLPSTISASPIDSPPSLNSPGSNDLSAERDFANERSSLSTAQVPIQGDKRPSSSQQIGSPNTSSGRNISRANSNNSARRGKYSLFPSCLPPEVKEEPLASPSALIPPTLTTQIHGNIEPEEHEPLENGAQRQKSRSRTVTLELRQHRVSALLSAGGLDQPQRSPAVTDEMIMSNFGVARNEPPPSPMPEIRVPGLKDLNIDLEFLKKPYRAPSKNHSQPSEPRRVPSGRRISVSRTDSPMMLAKAPIGSPPIGPPPTGPLPAVPTDSRRSSSRTNRSSQQSQRSQNRKGEQRPNFDALCHMIMNVERASKEVVTDGTQRRHEWTDSNSDTHEQTRRDESLPAEVGDEENRLKKRDRKLHSWKAGWDG